MPHRLDLRKPMGLNCDTVHLPPRSVARIFHEFTPWHDCDYETGNPLVEDTACGAGLSGLSRRSFSED